MGRDTQPDLTGLLAAWSGGDRDALDDLICLVYPEIRRIARQRLGRTGREGILESAAIANEAYVRLVRAKGFHCENRSRFFALCAHVIRRVIGEYVRTQGSLKRGGGVLHLPLDYDPEGENGAPAELLALDEALDVLSRIDPRKAALIEQHCFGGLTIEESAALLGVSPETAKRDWKFAKAWLRSQLAPRQ